MVISNWRFEDKAIDEAKADVMQLFEDYPENVFYSRQVEVFLEDKYYHWVTNAALRGLLEDNLIKGEREEINSVTITLYWNKSFRYYKRSKKYIIDAVNYFSDPEFNRAIGNHGEMLISDALFRGGFGFYASEVNKYKDKKWENTNHNLDLIVHKDGIGYGVEVKNTLGYMEKKELDIKINICKHLGIVPVFACRMLPKDWIHEINEAGGFAWIMKYQLYPFNEQDRAKEYKKELMLPIESPKRLFDGTIDRINKFHEKIKM